MSSRKVDFKISGAERGGNAAVEVDRVVEGVEPETTKTFRLPIRLSRALKIHAVQTGQTEKEILTRLIEDYIENNA